MLTEKQIDRAAHLLADARVQNAVIDCIPEDCRPRSLKEAYAVQERFIEVLGWSVGGWFCACTNPVIQKMLGLDEPYYARLLKDFILASPATLEAAKFPPILLECEFGFRLSTDLPSRAEPYSRLEVEAAVASVHPTIEVVAGHLKDWPEQGVFSVIADNGTDGALVYGAGVTDWWSLDLSSVAVTLRVNGRVEREGLGANVLGDPFEALVWLANARSRDSGGLKAGDMHNTGTATDIYWINAGDDVVAEFVGLGTTELSFV